MGNIYQDDSEANKLMKQGYLPYHMFGPKTSKRLKTRETWSEIWSKIFKLSSNLKITRKHQSGPEIQKKNPKIDKHDWKHQNGPENFKMAQKTTKWPRKSQNGPENVKMAQKTSKIVKLAKTLKKSGLDFPNWLHKFRNGLKITNIVWTVKTLNDRTVFCFRAALQPGKSTGQATSSG